LCRVWLATYEKQANAVDTRDEERVRDFIIAKVTLGLPEYLQKWGNGNGFSLPLLSY
jgi:hypothetical protein